MEPVRVDLARFYDETSTAVFSLAFHILRDRPAAEEAALEAYTRFWKEAETGRFEREDGLTWVLQRVRSCAIARLSPEMPNGVPARALTEGEGSGRRGRVQEAAARLSQRQWDVLALAQFCGLGLEQIARRLGLSLETVRAEARAGMLALRGALADHLASTIYYNSNIRS